MWIADRWKDYELLDASDGERLERWGDYYLVRPDPQILWHAERKNPLWKKAQGIYRRSRDGGGSWVVNRLPESWCVSYGELTFRLKPMGFKHTGLFPEQAANWDWFSPLIRERIRQTGEEVRVLNLFAYTGGATAAAAAAGASVVHVDASRGMVQAAKENLELSGLKDREVRYLVDDCKKLVEREIRRGRRYDAILMDPPSYGRGPGGEVWKLEECADELIALTCLLLSSRPLFVLINSYTTGISPSALGYSLKLHLPPELLQRGSAEEGEIGLRVSQTGWAIPAGGSVRWFCPLP